MKKQKKQEVVVVVVVDGLTFKNCKSRRSTFERTRDLPSNSQTFLCSCCKGSKGI